MSWYYEHPERFPSAIRHALPAAGTVLRDAYEIMEPLYICGTEVCCLGQRLSDGEHCLLLGLLPLHWCSVAPDGSFVPYHEDAANAWDAIRKNAFRRLCKLLDHLDEDSIPPIRDGFEALGTVWYVTPFAETKPLSAQMQGGLLSPQEATEQLSPLLNTLAGLHDASIFHGMLTADCIRSRENKLELQGWLDFEQLPAEAPSEDVRAVSLLLLQMMTGHTCWHDKAVSALPAPIQNALYNGIHDPSMTIDTLWNQLHAKHPAKRVKPEYLHAQYPSLLGKVCSPVVTAVFCVCCLVTPPFFWKLSTGKIGVQPAAQTLDDVAYSLGKNEVQLPEVLYLEQDEAVQQLEALGLNVLLATRVDNPVIPENQVLMQSPDAGAVLKAGDTVTLTVSDGWSNYVPDVCGLPFEQAKSKLEELGFIVESEEKPSADDAPGTVIRQSKKADTQLQRDSRIKLIVSLGRDDLDVSKTETIGDYVGTEFEKAREELSQMHLYAMQVETVYNPDVPAGIIISQDIAPGKQVAQGTVINMTVSKGVETVRVPSVIHASAANAKQLLIDAKLHPIIVYVSNAEYANDVILSQSITKGSLVAVGTDVILEASVGRGSYVLSTGGWSGNPLPTFVTEESTEESSETSDTMTDTDMTETTEAPDPTEEPLTDAPTVPDFTELTEESAEPTEELTAPPLLIE